MDGKKLNMCYTGKNNIFHENLTGCGNRKKSRPLFIPWQRCIWVILPWAQRQITAPPPQIRLQDISATWSALLLSCPNHAQFTRWSWTDSPPLNMRGPPIMPTLWVGLDQTLPVPANPRLWASMPFWCAVFSRARQRPLNSNLGLACMHFGLFFTNVRCIFVC